MTIHSFCMMTDDFCHENPENAAVAGEDTASFLTV